MIAFDVKITTKNGVACCGHFKCNEEHGMSSNDSKSLPQLPIEKSHDLLAHGHEANNRETAKALGIKLSRGALGFCKDCAVAHVEQKAVATNEDKVEAKKPNERIFVNAKTSKDQDGKIICNGNWSMTVDAMTGI